MALSNHQLAAIFSDIADRLEIQGENVFKVRAYRTASQNLLALPRPAADMWKEGALNEIPGVGQAINDKIDELMRTGQLGFYEKLKGQVPDGVAGMLQIPGLGPKRVKEIWEQLGVTNVEDLETAARAGKLRTLSKMGEKSEQKIIAGIESMRRRATGRQRIGDVLPVAQRLLASLRPVRGVQQIEYGGSLRRGRETIGDMDFVAATDDPAALMEAFRTLPIVAEVLLSGDTKTSVVLQNGMQVDLRTVEPARWGTALQYFTGSQAHNIRVRELAQKKGLSLNEYAFTRMKDEKEILCDSDEGVYKALGMAYIPPELREDHGEIEAALKNELPRLITVKDIKGDLQMHTTWSDGAVSTMEMARGAMALGYQYILITDHSQSLGIANGLTVERVMRQREEIDKVNAQLEKQGATFRVLQGIEVEVKTSGELDLPDETLAALDIVQASIHTSLSQPREQITQRVLSALQNPNVDILGHPSGRLINEREGGDFDWEALFHTAAEHDVALEINCDPMRLDLNETHARRAVELGCHLSISTDAHSPDMFANMSYGITVARRAWVTPNVVINTWPLRKLLQWVKKRG
jgi:DNA polymerase (family 10)